MKELDELLPWPLTVRGGCGEYIWIAAEPTDHEKELSPELAGEYWGIDVALDDGRSSEEIAREVVQSYCEDLLHEVELRCQGQDGRESDADQ